MLRPRPRFRGKPPPRGQGFLPSIRTEAADYQAKLGMTDVTDSARCPCCRRPLVARQGRAGPYFHCGCRKPLRI
jgi:hypothetical protein